MRITLHFDLRERLCARACGPPSHGPRITGVPAPAAVRTVSSSCQRGQAAAPEGAPALSLVYAGLIGQRGTAMMSNEKCLMRRVLLIWRHMQLLLLPL